MEKNIPDNYKIETRSLDKYINQQFADYHVPPLREFVNIKHHH